MTQQGYAILPATTEEAASSALSSTETLLVKKLKEIERRINHFVDDTVAYGDNETDNALKEIVHYDT